MKTIREDQGSARSTVDQELFRGVALRTRGDHDTRRPQGASTSYVLQGQILGTWDQLMEVETVAFQYLCNRMIMSVFPLDFCEDRDHTCLRHCYIRTPSTVFSL